MSIFRPSTLDKYGASPTEASPLEQYTPAIIGAEIEQIATAVYEGLGVGHSESTYRNALELEAEMKGWSVQREVVIPITYKGKYVGQGRCDLILTKGPSIILELKAVRQRKPEALLQLQNYLLRTGISFGYVINFGPKFSFEAVTRSSCDP